MKKKIITLAAIFAIGAPALAACGASTDSTQTESAATTAADATTTAATEATTTTADATTTSSGSTTAATDTTTVTSTSSADVNPYAWIGLQDMPKCNYLDIISTGKYIETVEQHALGIVAEQTEAHDGVNSYTSASGNSTYSVDGKVTSISEAAKMYMEYDMESLAETAKETYEAAMKDGTNTTGRAFVEKGKGTITGLDEDTNEYEYYEYNYPGGEEAGTSMTERFYMKDGDVYAIYQKVVLGESEVESVKLIKSISGEIPAGTFDLPDLSGYTKYE